MTHILKPSTQNIELANLSKEDATELFSLVDSCRDYLKEWLPWVKYNRAPDDMRGFISSFENTDFYTGRIVYKILLNRQIVGMIDMHDGNKSKLSADLGYWLAEKEQHKGIMTTACTQIINRAFDEMGLQRINIKCTTGNFKSQRIAEKLGFTNIGLDEKQQYIEGKFWDLLVYSISKEEWMRKQASNESVF
jgi:ribosomal-protein-serine acetyltransferase